MTKTGPAAEHASARAFNDYHPLGTPVRYWKGIREGDGKVARTRTEAQLLGGHTAVVWLEGVSGCIALTHIQPISEEELAAADRIPAPRPVPTFADRTATDALEELRTERVKTGRLEGDLRSQTRALREALAARDEATRICGEAGIEIYRLRAEQDEALAELRHVGQVLTDWRRAFTEEPDHEADRVLVDLIDAGLVPTAASSVPPRRAQGPRPGQFCTEHFSWLCQAGQGRCQGKRAG